MLRRLKVFLSPARPSLGASTWLSIAITAVAMTLLMPTPELTRAAYEAEENVVSASDQTANPLWSPVDSALDALWGGQHLEEEQTSDGDRQLRAGKHIVLQAGHWKYKESPAPFNTMTGTSGGSVTEPEVTLDIAQRTARILEDWGYDVEILPAWFAKGHAADAVVGIHADGSENKAARGFFAERYGNSTIPEVDDRFMATLDNEYAMATGLGFKYRSTPNSRYYYGFTLMKSGTPAVLIETGFLTNEEDREIIVHNSERSARGIANGIDRFLFP